jgi:hypothetical protein
MRFDLTDLKLFLHVVEAGSITAGAERMHLAVAAAGYEQRREHLAEGGIVLTPTLDNQGLQSFAPLDLLLVPTIAPALRIPVVEDEM